MLPPEQFKPIIGALILVVVGMVWFRPARPDKQSSANSSRALSIVLGFPLGAYQAFFGGGNTLLSSLMFCRTRGFDFKRALAHAYAVAFVWCSSAALLFWIEGWMKWDVVIPAAIGSTAGASVGSWFGRRLSHLALRRLFLIAGALMGGRLLFL